MAVTAIYAHLNCADVAQSGAWFTILFNRKADAAPMAGLLEWHAPPTAGFQLWNDPEMAGAGTMILHVQDIETECTRLEEAGFEPGDITPGGDGRLCQMRDPDGNLVVLVEAAAA